MKKSSFVEGSVIAIIAIVLTKILGMVYVIPFYHIVGAKGAALYAYAYNIYITFLDISTAGIPIAMSKIINEYNTLKMYDAKKRAFTLGKRIIFIMSLVAFISLFLFAPLIAKTLLGDLKGGNTIEDVAFTIRAVSFAILVIPFLSVTKGYLQGHKIINVSSFSQVLEQLVRISVILIGSFVTYKLLGWPLKYAIALSVFGAFLGGLIAYLYVYFKVRKNKKELNLLENKKTDDIKNSTIIKKIFTYAIPFIIISACMSLYNFVNMIFISRTLNMLKFKADDVEFITTSITTWAPKISMIITSLAMGMTTSLIPNIVEAFTLKKWDLVNNRLNKALQIILFISLPASLGIILLSKAIWTVFYGYSPLGVSILMVCIVAPIFQNVFMITSSTLQGLNKFKAVYLSTIIGLVINASLDIPLMILFNKFGLAYIGANLATIIGVLVSIIIGLGLLHKEHGLEYKKTFVTVLKLLLPLSVMGVVVYLLTYFVPFKFNRIYLVGYIGSISIIGASIYLFITYKMNIINELFGDDFLKKIIKKLTFGKFGN